MNLLDENHRIVYDIKVHLFCSSCSYQDFSLVCPDYCEDHDLLCYLLALFSILRSSYDLMCSFTHRVVGATKLVYDFEHLPWASAIRPSGVWV